MDLNEKSYDKIAKQWSEYRSKSLISQLIIDVIPLLPKNAKVLDLGCGDGFVSQYLVEQGCIVTGIDISENMISLAQSRNLQNADFINIDFFDYQNDEKFDFILAWDSLFHISLSKQTSIYPKVASMLKKGGFFLFTHGLINNEHKNEMMGENFYYSSLDLLELKKLLQNNGIKILKENTFYQEKDSNRDLIILSKLIK